MNYRELTSVRDRLNFKYKGRTLPNTDFEIRDVIIMPDERRSKSAYAEAAYALRGGVPLAEMEDSIKDNQYLTIKIRLTNTILEGLYPPEILSNF